MALSKQHFEWAARYVRELPCDSYTDNREPVMTAFMDLFSEFGPRFDVGRFREACQPRAAKEYGEP